MLYMYHSLFNRSPVEELLSYFLFEAVKNKAARNIYIYVFCKDKFLFIWDIYSGVQLLGIMVSACLVS